MNLKISENFQLDERLRPRANATAAESRRSARGKISSQRNPLMLNVYDSWIDNEKYFQSSRIMTYYGIRVSNSKGFS